MGGTRLTLRLERSLLRTGASLLAGMDEVGRGAIAGPVSVGVVVVNVEQPPAPAGVRDSKELRAPDREALVEPIRRWAVACAVGHASAQEIDDVGIIAALRRAGLRALTSAELALEHPIDTVLLDGSHNWLDSPAQPSMFDAHDESVPRNVVMRVKADRDCASVAAASVLAKVERDRLMGDLHVRFPDYGWTANKGYGSAEHLSSLKEHGPCLEHRRSWNLPLD